MSSDKKNLKGFLRESLEPLAVPKEQVLVLHVRLKGLVNPGFEERLGNDKYRELSIAVVEEIEDLFSPKSILVPSFTYSFTKTGIYDRTSTPSEVGRFGEEVREVFSPAFRTMNPVFSLVDCSGCLSGREQDETTAFGEDSIWSRLSYSGYVCVNINLPELVSTHLHYLEAKKKVSYRYAKKFHGRVSDNGYSWRSVDYEYYVRDLDYDTKWRRGKIARDMEAAGILFQTYDSGFPLRWFFSRNADEVVGQWIEEDSKYLVKD